ncbi:MAG: malto-oligosyltrehalose trehalohydrolase, partial [Calditrichaceae bacterium]
MTKFRVWAPKAKKMEIQINKNKTAMRPEDGGWWELEVNEAVPGTDYTFIIDSSKPLPDPRSLYQPQGVHGPSRVVDHSVFKWNDHHWQPAPLASAVIYELHIGTFTRDGTFDAAIEKLDYLAELGITHVELMPVNEFPGSHGWGYDGVDLYAPHHAYGGPEALKRLVDACHAKNLAIILDVVYNHLGPSGNYLSQFGPYFTERYHTPWGEAVNLDGRGSVEVRKFFIDNALMWLRDYHFDCLRIDAVHAILDTSAIHFLEEMALEVGALEAQIGRKLTLIAESDLNDPRVIRPREIGGFGIDAQWNEDFHHALHAVLTREDKGYYADFGTLGDLADCLQNGFTYDGRFSVYRGRIHGKPAAGIFGRSFIGCIQNHDQVGNRARGDRISHITGHNRAKIAAALVLT